jgi:elongation factor G
MPDHVHLIEVALEPRSKDDLKALVAGLSQIVREDPSVAITTDGESGQTILKGISEPQLERIVARLRQEFGAGIDIGAPQVSYLETISTIYEVDYSHKKQTNSGGQYARVKMRFEPLPEGSGVIFEATVAGGAVPSQYISSIANALKTSRRDRRFSGGRLQSYFIRRGLPRCRLHQSRLRSRHQGRVPGRDC